MPRERGTNTEEQVQAPRRDEESKTRWKPVQEAMESAAAEDQPSAFCKALEFLLERVNAMRIDAANARLRLIAPVINTHGIDYERGKFADKLVDGSFTLERTKARVSLLLSLARVVRDTTGWGCGPIHNRHTNNRVWLWSNTQQVWLNVAHTHTNNRCGWPRQCQRRWLPRLAFCRL